MPAVGISVGWDMGHRLPNHKGACWNLHGHFYRAEVFVVGEISTEPMSPSEGMIVDFTMIKTQLREQVAKLDHRFLLYENDPIASQMAHLPGVVLVSFIPTAENIALALLHALPTASRVVLWETPTSFAEVER